MAPIAPIYLALHLGPSAMSHTLRATSILAASALALTLTGAARAQSIVRNLQTTPTGGAGTSAGIERFVPAGNLVFFAGNGLHGRELWVTDGTTLGTRLILDINSGTADANPEDLVALGSRVLFAATNDSIGDELWISDGSAAGTSLVVDLVPGAGSSVPRSLVRFGSEVLFLATDGASGREIWATDGTAAGTVVRVETVLGAQSASPADLVATPTQLFFTASTNASGRELWVSDGTQAGTRMVGDINPGTPSSSIVGLTPFGNGVVFQANDGSTGIEPYYSDGTAIVALGDIAPGAASSGPDPFVVSGGLAYFTANGPFGRELYATNGTTAGTSLVRDIVPGPLNSAIDDLYPFAGGVVFAANDGTTGDEVWKSDGTAAGTVLVADITPGPGGSSPAAFVQVGSDVWFSATSPTFGEEMWRTDGTAAGTGLVVNLFNTASTAPRDMIPFGNGVICTGVAAGTGREPFFINANGGQSGLLREVRPATGGSDPQQWVRTTSGAAFSAFVVGSGRELWLTDGSFAGTTQVEIRAGSQGSFPEDLAEAGGRLFFQANDGSGLELWAYDGTIATQLTTGQVAPTDVVPAGSRVVFNGNLSGAGRELWSSDGTPGGTSMLLDIQPGASTSAPGLFHALDNGRVVFRATGPTTGRDLYSTDGTAGGTFAIDLNPGSGGSNPDDFAVVPGGAFFSATNGSSGTELFFTDGTIGGTRLVADIRPGGSSSSVTDITPSGNRVFFTAFEPGVGREIWVSDGTMAGTRLVVDLEPGSASSVVRDLTGAAGGAFFRFDDGSGVGEELWYTDGTAAGTRRLGDIGPGPLEGVVPESLAPVLSGGALAFAANDFRNGLQLWVSDGTVANTLPVSSFGQGGAGAVVLSDFVDAGTKVLFSADDGIQGEEPWVYSLGGGGTAFVVEYGSGCAESVRPVPDIGPFGGLPTPGNSGFGVTLDLAQPGSLTFLLLAFAPSNASIGGSCRRWIDFPIETYDTVFASALGTASSMVPIPNDPTLIGLSAYFQWAVLAPPGAFLGTFDISNALQIQIGN